MSSSTQVLILNNIKLPLNASINEAFSLAEAKMRLIRRNPKEFSYSVYKKSIDARNKNNIIFVYSVMVSGEVGTISARELDKISATKEFISTDIDLQIGSERLSAPPLVVGAGPCGLFAALLLAEQGYNPTVIERGGSIKERIKAVELFNKNGILNTDTNIQFGAGGAGTFSDGKLVTRVNDPLSSYILRRFVEFGAPEEIQYLAKPHIGTDILSGIIEKISSRIEELGGRVLYNTKYISSKSNGQSFSAITSAGEIPYGALILAIGHSARDTYMSLLTSGYVIEPKPFSVGMRIEHKADEIDKAMFGNFAGHEALGHAEYNLSYNTKIRGVYTFCMCPGGEVVAAASEGGGVVVNGMSNHARCGVNSNSAVVCSIFKEDYGSTPERAIEFQRTIERNAFISGGNNYSAPIITVGDFLNDKCITDPYDVMPTYRGGAAIKLASPEEYLPDFVCKSIKNTLHAFDNKIKGFAAPGAILTGAETRTSAPVRIVRNSETRLAAGQTNVYPAGEGAGYAGGITSAAIDGIKTAIAIINKYKP